MDISILYEDNDVVVIDKPSGVMVHSDGYVEGETIADWFLDYFPGAKGVGEPVILTHGKNEGKVVDRPGVVHRLDVETSGVLVLAKNQDIFLYLKRQFHDRKIKKEYRAFVHGIINERHGSIDRPIGRSAKDFRLRSAQRGAKGTLRDAKTDWELLEVGSDCSYVKLFPKTGRTHQIRAHMKAINHPVICDKLYASNYESLLGFNRLALHAHVLILTLPNNEIREVSAPLPASFDEALEQLRT